MYLQDFKKQLVEEVYNLNATLGRISYKLFTPNPEPEMEVEAVDYSPFDFQTFYVNANNELGEATVKTERLYQFAVGNISDDEYEDPTTYENEIFTDLSLLSAKVCRLYDLLFSICRSLTGCELNYPKEFEQMNRETVACFADLIIAFLLHINRIADEILTYVNTSDTENMNTEVPE